MPETIVVAVPETDGESVSQQNLTSAWAFTSSQPLIDFETIAGIEAKFGYYFKISGAYNNVLAQTSGKFVALNELNFESSLEAEFQRCAAAWKRDTGHLSVEGEIATHEAYQSIISMGAPAIPLILEDLRQESHHWFIALDELTGESPELPEEDYGSIDALSDAWVKWGKSKGYID